MKERLAYLGDALNFYTIASLAETPKVYSLDEKEKIQKTMKRNF